MARYRLSPLSIRETTTTALPVSGATVTVYLAGTSTLATCYANTTTGTALTGSQTTTTASGYFEFFIDSKDYTNTQKFKIVITKTGYPDVTYDYLNILIDLTGVRDPWIDVRAYGAVGDGVTDDRAAIQLAIDSNDGMEVRLIPDATHAISGQLFIGNGKLKGEQSKIYINTSSTFTLNELSGNVHHTRPAVLSKSAHGSSYSAAYSSGQKVFIEGVEFVMNKQTASPLVSESLLLENITEGYIKNCKHTATNAQLGEPHNSFDFFSNVKNVKVEDCVFETLSNPADEMGVNRQGGFWVRNHLATGASAPDATENITIKNCKFYSNQWDELLGIFTNDYEIKNIRVVDCDFFASDDASTGHGMMMVIGAPLSGDPGDTGSITGVSLNGCNFYTVGDTTTYWAIKCLNAVYGGTTYKAYGVSITNCKFFVKVDKANPENSLAQVISDAELVSDCYINILGDDSNTTNPIKCIKGAEIVNNVSVKFESGLNCPDALRYATSDCGVVSNIKVVGATVNTEGTIMSFWNNDTTGIAAKMYVDTALSDPSTGVFTMVMPWGGRVIKSSAIPTTGTWSTGDLWWSTTPTPGGKNKAWCHVGGTPGTWRHDLPDRTSTDVGDASATVTVGSSYTTLRWNTAITQDRAVTLNTTGALTGDKVRCTRQSGCTGAFNINVGTGPLKALSAAGQWCDVEYDGTVWVLTAYGTL